MIYNSEFNAMKHLLWVNIEMFTQVVRQGSDITLVGWGAQLSIMEQACLDAEKVRDSSIALHSALNNVCVYFWV